MNWFFLYFMVFAACARHRHLRSQGIMEGGLPSMRMQYGLLFLGVVGLMLWQGLRPNPTGFTVATKSEVPEPEDPKSPEPHRPLPH